MYMFYNMNLLLFRLDSVSDFYGNQSTDGKPTAAELYGQRNGTSDCKTSGVQVRKGNKKVMPDWILFVASAKKSAILG